jgi:hypothetical protein
MRAFAIGAFVVGFGCQDVPHALPPTPGADVDAGPTVDDVEPLGPEWPSDEPLPPEIDLPPWLTMPAENRVVVSWRTVAPSRGGVFLSAETGDGLVLVSPAFAELHHVDLGVLEPATTYEYEVFVDGTSIARRGVFVTPGRDHWRFAHLAEFHAPSDSATVAKFAAALRTFRPHVVVESGDMCDSGNNMDHWRSYLRTSAPWISNVILLPAHSNHVNGSLGNPLVHELFALPGNERWYRTRWGQVEFYTLDSTYNGINPDVPTLQLDWLRDGLLDMREAADRPLFIIGAWHYPACSSHYASREAQHLWALDNLVDGFLAAGELDLALTGHDKYYERSLIDGRVVHVMSNAGRLAPSVEGGNAERCDPIVTNTRTRSVALFDVDGGAITGIAVNEQGAWIDAFVIDKEAP